MTIHKASDFLVVITTSNVLDHSDDTSFLSISAKKFRFMLRSKILMNGNGLGELELTVKPVGHVRERHTKVELVTEPSIRASILFHFVINTLVSSLESNSGSVASSSTPVSKIRFLT